MNTFFFDDVQYPEGLFGGKDFFNPIIYSTEEREVGVWANGKPLYAKTFIQQLSGNAGQVDISACGADMMFVHSGYYDIGVTMLGLNERLNNQLITYTHVNLDTMQYIDCTNTIATNSTIIVCCLYTKTTDTAGSGSYASLGIPAHHYDSNEKVVGTWFGETLYEKTFDCGGLLNAQTKEISFNENMDTIIIVDAFAMSTNEGYVIPIPDDVPNYVAGSLRLYINKTTKKICIYTQTDMRTYDKSYVTLRYTKYTD